ncbi:MAG: GntR family transcriptional regulator, partial [Clostridia bacterium]|nr:GntR family transcriptional regulator [Clostridia bacterium]
NPNTVQRALAELENTGILFTKRGDGRYITDDQQAIEQLKTRFVSKKAETFVSSLKELGLDNAAIVTAVKNSLQESKGDDS